MYNKDYWLIKYNTIIVLLEMPTYSTCLLKFQKKNEVMLSLLYFSNYK
jgi:hypothetical protein